MRNRSHAARLALSGVAALAVAACGDRSPTVVSAPPPSTPATPVVLGSIRCAADARALSVSCGQAALPAEARGYIVVGGQDQYVSVKSVNGTVGYNTSTHVFSFNVTVQNLIPQPMGTTDGATPDGSGVRVVFASGPNVDSGGGAASVFSPDGTGAFTAAGQPYFAYTGNLLGADGILSQNETSGQRTFTLSVDPAVGTFSFLLYVVAEVPHPNGYVDVTAGAANVVAGGSTTLTGVVRSAVGNPISGQTITWGTGDNTVATVDAGGNVSAVAPGLVTLTATSGSRSGSVTLAVCPSLGVGQVYVATVASFCIGSGTAAAAEYTVTPVNLGITDVSFSVTGSGIVAVSGPPTPDRLPSARALAAERGPVEDESFHLALLRRAIGMQGRVTPARAPAVGGARRNIVPGVPTVGTVMNLNVSQSFCSPLDIRASTVRAVGTHVIVMEDNSNPAGGFSTAQYDSIAATFDTLVYPAVAGTFGAPGDIDANLRVIALYTAAVNDLTPAGSSSYVGGFFYSRDLLTTTSCPGSNQGEMFYMLAPDPTGAHGNVRTTGFVDTVTIGTLGHEFQHLINASLRLGHAPSYPLEQVWLNEGLSHVAEEEVYYASSLHGPGENIGFSAVNASPTQQGRFLRFAEPNFGRLRQWLLHPDTSGAFKDADALSIRGATWAFLRYAADRKGGLESTFFSSLAFSPDTGMTNLANRLGTDPKPWFRDFATAMYLDDSGTGPAAAYTEPSWNFRSVYGGLSYSGQPAGYPLATRNPANGVAESFTVSQGAGAGYVRMGVPASAFARLTATAPSSALALMVMRTK
jgi:hypothetical protein